MHIEKTMYAVLDNKRKVVVALTDDKEEAFGIGVRNALRHRNKEYWTSKMQEEDYESLQFMRKDLYAGLETLWDAFEMTIKEVEGLDEVLYAMM